jgi:hypothetical protein
MKTYTSSTNPVSLGRGTTDPVTLEVTLPDAKYYVFCNGEPILPGFDQASEAEAEAVRLSGLPQD